jgi:hypothetical protein
MKNYYLITALLGLLLMGCSVDNDELNLNNDQIQTVNSVLEVDGCETLSADLYCSVGTLLGEFKITNNNDNLYLNFLAKDGFLIYDIRWQVFREDGNIPVNGSGINSSKLANRDKFNSGTVSHGETVSLIDFEDETSLIIVAELEYKNSLNQRFITWIGDQEVGRNGSKFLVYDICPPISDPVCVADAGGDVIKTYTLKEIDNLVDSYEELDTLLRSLLDDGVDRSGTFDPTPRELGRKFYFEGKFQDFNTTYTITNELDGTECSDSAEFIITIIP